MRIIEGIWAASLAWFLAILAIVAFGPPIPAPWLRGDRLLLSLSVLLVPLFAMPVLGVLYLNDRLRVRGIHAVLNGHQRTANARFELETETYRRVLIRRHRLACLAPIIAFLVVAFFVLTELPPESVTLLHLGIMLTLGAVVAGTVTLLGLNFRKVEKAIRGIPQRVIVTEEGLLLPLHLVNEGSIERALAEGLLELNIPWKDVSLLHVLPSRNKFGCFVFEIQGMSQRWCAPYSRLTLQTADPIIVVSREPFGGREREFLQVALEALGESRIAVKDGLAPSKIGTSAEGGPRRGRS